FNPGTPVTGPFTITPLFDETSNLSKGQQQFFGASKYLVTWTPLTTDDVGTYSFQVGPTIADRIRRPGVAGNTMDQDANGVGAGGFLDIYADPAPLNPNATWNGLFFTPAYSQDTLPIIVPGPHIISSHVAGNSPTNDNLVLNGTV